jgi:capsular polysaccharide biosynthesis protein
MIRKLLEALFRHKLLLLLPPILIPAIVTPLAFSSAQPVYDTWVGVWVEKPEYLQYADGANPWLTPVQVQSNRLTELLGTRAFQMEVAQRTPLLAPLAASPSGEGRIGEILSRSISIGSTNNGSEHLLVLRVQANSAQLSYEICKALVEAFQDKTGTDQVEQAGLAVKFYEARLKDAQAQLAKATQDLRRYAASREIEVSERADITNLAAELPASMLDARFSQLQSTVQTAQGEVNRNQSALTQAQQDSIAAVQGQQFNFQVLDAPRLATAPTSQMKKLLIYPIAAVGAGLGLSAMLLVLLVAADRSVRSEADLPSGIRIIGGVPLLKRKGIPKRLRGVATRRGVGAIAGMQLPAPGGSR